MIVKSDNARSLGWAPKAPKIEEILRQMIAQKNQTNGHVA